MEQNKSIVLSGKICKVDKYFPVDFLKELYSKVDDVQERAYVMYHAETGLRVSDVVATELVHVDWTDCKTYTYDHKKDEWRYVFWPESIKAALKMWLVERDRRGIKDKRLFPFSEKTANRVIKKWCLRLNFHFKERVSSHWFRHTFIRLSRRAGRDIKAVQQNTGDKIGTLLEWYEALSPDEMRNEVNNKPLINS